MTIKTSINLKLLEILKREPLLRPFKRQVRFFKVKGSTDSALFSKAIKILLKKKKEKGYICIRFLTIKTTKNLTGLQTLAMWILKRLGHPNMSITDYAHIKSEILVCNKKKSLLKKRKL